MTGRAQVRLLGPADLPKVLACLATDPVPNVFVEHRARTTGLDRRLLVGEMWGYGSAPDSVCHVGANLVPANADREACVAFGEWVLRRRPTFATVVGPQASIEPLWETFQGEWDRPRDERWDQPHLVLTGSPLVAPDPAVRRSTLADLDVVYPACVAMYTEEVGVSPEWEGSSGVYRSRVAQLIRSGWSFARIDDGRVVFKAEVACLSPHAAQIQGVYVAPDRRGEGLAQAGMAAVAAAVLADLAPAVSLYVNAHNLAARAAYAKVGFKQTATFATLMF